MPNFRTEHDSMGELKVPANALWGAQTQRAVDNFPISGLTLPRDFVRALGLIKTAAADANLKLGHLKSTQAAAIRKASGNRAHSAASSTAASGSAVTRGAPSIRSSNAIASPTGSTSKVTR